MKQGGKKFIHLWVAGNITRRISFVSLLLTVSLF